MVESILRSAGYRTGLFTSPHLCDVRERIRLDGCARSMTLDMQLVFSLLEHATSRHGSGGVAQNLSIYWQPTNYSARRIILQAAHQQSVVR